MGSKRLGFRFIACFSALILAAPIVARADVIFDNGGPDYLASQISDFDANTQFADDFVLQAGSATITDVHWWGVYAYDNSPGTDNFTIRIFEDNSGAPATDYSQQIAVSNAHRTPTGNTFLSSDAYAYSADISPITLTAGTTYWISIVNNTATDSNDNWQWLTSNAFTGNSYYRFSDTHAWDNQGGTEMAFNLTNDGIVPEPASLTLLGIGLAGLAGRKIRKRA